MGLGLPAGSGLPVAAGLALGFSLLSGLTVFTGDAEGFALSVGAVVGLLFGSGVLVTPVFPLHEHALTAISMHSVSSIAAAVLRFFLIIASVFFRL